MDGPSAERLRLVLRYQRQMVHQMANDTVLLVPRSETLWEGRSDSKDKWQTAAVLYSHGQPHQVNLKDVTITKWDLIYDHCPFYDDQVGIRSHCRQFSTGPATFARPLCAGQRRPWDMEGKRR